MNNMRNLFLVLLFPLTLLACHQAGEDEGNVKTVYRSIPYAFGINFYCIPLEDFSPSQITLNGSSFKLSKKIYSRSNALLGDGGLVDRVRFFSGDGRINLDFNIPRGHGYFLRVLRCSDIFSGARKIRGFSIFVRSSKK